MRPARRLLLVLGLWLAVAVVAAFVPAVLSQWIGLGGAIVVLAAVDLLALSRRPPPRP